MAHHTISSRDLDPAKGVLREFEQPGKIGLTDSLISRNSCHVVDDEITTERGEIVAMSRKCGGINMQDDMPTELGNASGCPLDLGDFRLCAQMTDKIEARTPQPCDIQGIKLSVAGGIIRQTDPPVVPIPALYRIDHRPVIATVHGGLDEDSAAETEPGLKRLIGLKRGLGRLICPVGPVGELLWRAKDVAMRIA
jgi:hypothetical protein